MICSSLYAEFIRNYRREVTLGRRLASLGIAVQRFHYRGQGNSGGHTDRTTFDSMLQDSITAAAYLRALSGAEAVAFLGSRLGGLVAGAAASHDDSALALWDPVLEADGYFRDVHRARRVQALRGDAIGKDGSIDLIEQLERSGSVPVLGYTIARSLYRSFAGRSLEREMGDRPRKVLLIRMGPRTDPLLRELTSAWIAKGSQVDIRQLETREAWWFSAGEDTSLEAMPRVVEETVTWALTVFEPESEGQTQRQRGGSR